MFTILTCGGHSHFRKKSSLALARNSFTKKRAKTDPVSIQLLPVDTYWIIGIKTNLGLRFNWQKRPNAIVLEGERKKRGEWKLKCKSMEKNMGKVNSHLDIN